MLPLKLSEALKMKIFIIYFCKYFMFSFSLAPLLFTSADFKYYRES